MFEADAEIQLEKKITYNQYQKDLVREYLEKKGINENFINDILKFGLVGPCINALLDKGLTCEDIQIVRKILSDESDSDICDCSSSSEATVLSKHLEADYLKEHFANILSAAMREIAMKRPFDPIEYLGHWLLYYRNCEEREKARKEFEAELLEERLKWQETHKNPCLMFLERHIPPDAKYYDGEEEGEEEG